VALIRKFIDKIRNRPPKIHTPFGETTEWCRLQAAINLRLDHAKRDAVEAMLAEEMGSVEAGKKEARRRFPESYVEDNDAKAN